MKFSGGPGGTAHARLPRQIQAVADKLNDDDKLLLTSVYFSAPGKVFSAVRAMELALKNNNWEHARKYLEWCKSRPGFDQDAAPESGMENISLFPWSAGNPEVQ